MGDWTDTTWGEVSTLMYGKSLRDYRKPDGDVRVFGTNGPVGWATGVAPLASGPRPVVGRKGAYRGVHLATGDFWVIDTAYWLKPEPDLDPLFSYYRLLTVDINGMDSGSAIPSLSRDHFAALPLRLPPVDEQRRIAAVLGAFDDLIETSRALAGQLHDAAQMAGLKMLERYAARPHVPLRDVAAISKGYSYKSAELLPGSDTLVNLKNFGRGGVFNHDGFKPLTSDRYKPSQVVEPGDVAISMTDLTQQREVIARPIRIPRAAVEGKMVASLDLAIARPRNGHDREFIAAALSQEAFHSFARNYCNGTTVLHMSVKAFDDFTIPDISPSEAAPFVERIRILNGAEDSCRDEVADLTRTRDELLPLLMSGRVRVEDVEGLV